MNINRVSSTIWQYYLLARGGFYIRGILGDDPTLSNLVVLVLNLVPVVLPVVLSIHSIQLYGCSYSTAVQYVQLYILHV